MTLTYGGQIEKLEIRHYKKLQDLTISFTPGVNIISGANGTCKSSLLHLVSNSFQKVTRGTLGDAEKELVEFLSIPDFKLNPKVETLARGDRNYNDPAYGTRGVLYEAKYDRGKSLEFRRHNTGQGERYSLKPHYAAGSGQSLPAVPVFYLGLSRLVPAGEYTSDDEKQHRKINLDKTSLERISQKYRSLTGIQPIETGVASMGGLKSRITFTTNSDGIDSNTISAGQDNLLIILYVMETLRRFHEESIGSPGSILLIDEFDASLHPPLQSKLLDEFKKLGESANVQTIVTTHSMGAIEHAMKQKMNVIYLIDVGSRVTVLSDPTLRKIQMNLTATSRDRLFADQKVVVFTEDREAREMITALFDMARKRVPDFASPLSYFSFIDVNMGAEQLKSLFTANEFRGSMPNAICILDGDHRTFMPASKICHLPGGDSPEKFLFNFSKRLFESNDPVFGSDLFIDEGYSRESHLEFSDRLEKNLSALGGKKAREVYKAAYRKDTRYFELLMKVWMATPAHYKDILKFFTDLGVLWKKVVQPFGVPASDWSNCIEQLTMSFREESC